jgi:hypothetical protein
MTQSRTSFPFTPLSVKKSLKIRPVGGRTIRNLFVFKVGANPSEICLFFKVGANPSENFWNLTLEAFLSDSILLKNEARWVKKASSAPNGGSLKDLHEKESFDYFVCFAQKQLYLLR